MKSLIKKEGVNMEHSRNEIIEATINIIKTAENRCFYEYELETIRRFMWKYVWGNSKILGAQGILLWGSIENRHYVSDYPTTVLNKIFHPKGKVLTYEELGDYTQKFGLEERTY